jgi:capsular polysaccharide transport system permease protein
MLREMATTYGRSPGGYLWAVLDPVAAVALLSAVFSLAFSAPPIGSNFPLFYATGYIPFMMFNDIANKLAASTRFSLPLLAYPSVTFIDALIARFLLNALTHMMVAYLVFMGIIVFFAPGDIVLDLPSIVAGILLAALLGLGVGTLNCYLMTEFSVWERSWQILTRPLFMVSGIFFIYDAIPEAGQDYIWFNPLIHIVGMMRRGFYPTYEGNYVSPLYVTAVGLSTLVPGLALLYLRHRRLMES